MGRVLQPQVANFDRTHPPFHRVCRFGHAELCEVLLGKDKS
jgi:hypothetical protein